MPAAISKPAGRCVAFSAFQPQARTKLSSCSSSLKRARLITRPLCTTCRIIPGQTLYVLEVEPAPYAALAANEAEKAASINILEVRAFGSFGRVYLGGEERDIDVGWRAAVKALEGLEGREEKKGKG